jgi:hypothetical protein
MWQILAVVVIGAMLAHWTWALFAPRGDSVMPAIEPDAAIQAEHLFGIAVAPVASNVPLQAALPNVKLLGVFSGKPGFAILELDGKSQKWLATGSEIVPGAKLVEVATDHVVIARGAVRQEVLLEGRATAAKNAVAAQVHPVH